MFVAFVIAVMAVNASSSRVVHRNGSVIVDYILNFKLDVNSTLEETTHVLDGNTNSSLAAFGVDSKSVMVSGKHIRDSSKLCTRRGLGASSGHRESYARER